MIRDTKTANKAIRIALLITLVTSSSSLQADMAPQNTAQETGQNTPTRTANTAPGSRSHNTASSQGQDSIEFMLGGALAPPSREEAPAEDVTELISNNCSNSGDAEYYDSVCKRSYSNGSTSDVTTHGEIHGSELKIQSQTVDYDKRGHQTGRQTIREKIKFKYEENTGERLKETHYVDVVARPTEGKVTREFYIYKYDVKSQKLVSSTWTKYEQINLTRYASLIYNVVLEYDLDGTPLKGKAERWKDGKRLARIFDWNRKVNRSEKLDWDVWNQWKEKTENVFITRLGKDGSSLAGASVSSF